MFTTQNNNAVGGDLVAGNKTVTYNYNGATASPLARLYERLRQEGGENKFASELREKLHHFCNVGTDGDVRGLEEKLRVSQRKDQIPSAERLKEQSSKLIMKWQTSNTAQDILTMILGKMYTAFHLKVVPAIENSEPRGVIDKLIYEHVIEPAEQMLGDNDLSISNDDLLGLLYFLGGNCHIRWDKC